MVAKFEGYILLENSLEKFSLLYENGDLVAILLTEESNFRAIESIEEWIAIFGENVYVEVADYERNDSVSLREISTFVKRESLSGFCPN